MFTKPLVFAGPNGTGKTTTLTEDPERHGSHSRRESGYRALPEVSNSSDVIDPNLITASESDLY
jgi:DNA polymerase III delta prime subunit